MLRKHAFGLACTRANDLLSNPVNRDVQPLEAGSYSLSPFRIGVRHYRTKRRIRSAKRAQEYYFRLGIWKTRYQLHFVQPVHNEDDICSIDRVRRESRSAVRVERNAVVDSRRSRPGICWRTRSRMQASRLNR